MLIIGLTGSIASGKSTVSSIFKKRGIDTISADEIARDITQKGNPTLTAIKNHFGTSVLDAKGNLNRKALRNLIFKNNNERLWLNNLLHPLIREELKRQSNSAVGPYVLVEIPLLNNPIDYPYLDRILLVVSDENTQLERILQRDRSSIDEAKAIIASQVSNEARIAFSTEVIHNTGSIKELEQDIETLHEKYLLLSKTSF